MKIADIAKLAGVSSATVSRVFSHHPNIREEVRDKVMKIAKKHGYHPRVSQKQRNVVIILPEDEIYPIRNCLEMVMMALTLKLPEHGFRIEVLPQNNLDRLDNLQFCGGVAIGADPEQFRTWSARFTPPLVLVDRDVPKGSSGIYSVRSDEAQGMELAISHLHERGCRKIGCIIYGALGSGNADERHKAVVAALKRHGCPVNEGIIQICKDDEYIETIGKMLKQGIDALFCPGGNAGIVTAYALSLFNKQVPQDISLVTSEHKLFSRYATPPHTAISQDHKALAEIVCNILEQNLEGSTPEKQQILPYKMICRDSVRHI
ncbi:MAG: LacI family DNA-binding transcriptional regulator [Planctomycetes bacterium]|nr:LacI family DNA-binding transcriptional regulator [Planctomycetota bacterium]